METFILAILILKLIVFLVSFIVVFFHTKPKRNRLFDNYTLRRNEECPGNKEDAAISGIHDVIPREYEQCIN